jgi:hypothetical protein
MFNVELSTEMSVATTLGLNFMDLTTKLRALEFAGYAKKDTFNKAIKVMIDVLEENPVDCKGFNAETKKFFELYKDVSPANKAVLKRDFIVVLGCFAKCFMSKRLPVALCGKIFYCSSFIRELQLKDIFAYLEIPVDSRLTVAQY